MCSYGHVMLNPLDPRTLKSARVAANLSRSELAGLANVSETTILRIEKGEVDPRLAGTWGPLVRALEARAA